MTNQDSDGLFEGDWEDRSELAWGETEWERYLAVQDKAVRDYLAAYEAAGGAPDRIDLVARQLGWEPAAPEGEEPIESLDEEEEFPDKWEPYTVHRNPVYISTKALHQSLVARLDQVVAQPGAMPASVATGLLGSFHRTEDAALHGIHALEMGDYTLAVCFFKRALRALNGTMAILGSPATAQLPGLVEFRSFAQPRLFDLREIWLRVMNECRAEPETNGED
jgi:hypothetical protein